LKALSSPHACTVSWLSTQVSRTQNGKRTMPSMNGVGKTGYLQAEE
jgi:hypothetical protein